MFYLLLIKTPWIRNNIEKRCWNNENARKTTFCVKMRSDTVRALNEHEKAKPRINIKVPKKKPQAQTTYKSDYGYQIKIPLGYVYKTTFDDGYYTLYMRKLNSPNGDENVSIVIGSPNIYSTSGALCANQGCIYDAGSIHIKDIAIPLVKGYSVVLNDNNVPIDTKLNFYRFSYEIKGTKVVSKFSGVFPAVVTGEFVTIKDGEEIANILSTLQAD